MKKSDEVRVRYDKGASVEARAILEMSAVMSRRKVWTQSDKVRIIRTLAAFYGLKKSEVFPE